MGKRKIVIFLIGLGFICLLLFFFLKTREKRALPLPSLSPSPTEVAWQVYSNQDYDYILSYPPDWQVKAWDIKEAADLKKVPDGSIWHQAEFEGEEGKFEVVVWENKTKAPLLSWLSRFRHEDLDLSQLPKEENFEVGGLPAVLYSNHIFFQSKDKIYELIKEKGTISPQASKVNYDKIVSSFSFLEDGVEIEPQAEKLVSSAKENLAQKLGVKSEEIELTKIEPVDWPDTSLGCPEEGMFYAQVITPGYKITLNARGKTYTYHSDYQRVVLCEK